MSSPNARSVAWLMSTGNWRASSSVMPPTRSRAFRSRSAVANRPRFSTSPLGRTSRSIVGRDAPCARAATPPTIRHSTPCRSRASRSASGSNGSSTAFSGSILGLRGNLFEECLHLLGSVQATSISSDRHVVIGRRRLTEEFPGALPALCHGAIRRHDSRLPAHRDAGLSSARRNASSSDAPIAPSAVRSGCGSTRQRWPRVQDTRSGSRRATSDPGTASLRVVGATADRPRHACGLGPRS